MLAAKNNRRHLDITPCVQVCAVLRLLYDTDPGVMIVAAEVLAGKRSQLVKALGVRFCWWIFEDSPFDLRRISSWQGGGHF
jgi:hypothetical protein